MSLHFLLKAEARTLSVVQVLAMSDDDAFTLFREVRWGDGEKVVCPHCSMAHRHYFRPARKICGIMEQPPPAADTQPGENSLVFNEREHFPWRRAAWLRH